MRGTAAAPARISAVLVVAAVPVLVHLAIFEISRSHADSVLSIGGVVKFGLVTAVAATHWAIYGGLLVTFGLTLRPGREALITTIARRMLGELPDALARYTRGVTWAWCCFFAGQLVTSIGLFFFAPLVVWSFFVNVLDLPLVAAMFGAEYLFRLRWVPNAPRHSMAEMVRMVADIRKPPRETAGFS